MATLGELTVRFTPDVEIAEKWDQLRIARNHYMDNRERDSQEHGDFFHRFPAGFVRIGPMCGTSSRLFAVQVLEVFDSRFGETTQVHITDDWALGAIAALAGALTVGK